jgi:hypothetical protein
VQSVKRGNAEGSNHTAIRNAEENAVMTRIWFKPLDQALFEEKSKL